MAIKRKKRETRGTCSSEINRQIAKALTRAQERAREGTQAGCKAAKVSLEVARDIKADAGCSRPTNLRKFASNVKDGYFAYCKIQPPLQGR